VQTRFAMIMPRALFLRLLTVLSLLGLGVAAQAQTRCNEEDAGPSFGGRDLSMLDTSSANPRAQLQDLVRDAIKYSKPLGSARLLAEAAKADMEQALAARKPTINLSGNAGYAVSSAPNVPQTAGFQTTGTLSLNMTLYDFGQIKKVAEWRTELAEAAKFSQEATEEQLALQTVALALDRGRYILQAQIYQQYTRRMACLVDSLETIVKADKGRASELVQAKKNMQQSDLAYVQTLDSLKGVETRMKHLVGDKLPVPASMSTVLLQVPELNEVMADMLQAADIAGAAAQARAQHRYAESVAASEKPQVSWTVTTSAVGGVAPSKTILGGIGVNIPLYIPGADSARLAAQRRAEAQDLQRDEAIEAKRYRLMEMNDSALATIDRAKRIVDILRNSDRVRFATLQQWQQLGRRSLFDVMGAEGDYYSMRIAHVNALFDAEQVVATMWSMGRGVQASLQ